MDPLRPRHVASLFLPLHAELLGVLGGLAPEQWTQPTVAGSWRVHDVAMHLLDGDLRKLSVTRDGHVPTPDGPTRTPAELAGYINAQNALGVAFGDRLSPRLIVDLLALTGHWIAQLMESLSPDEPSTFSVSWAGEDESPNWMDIGREYTERWHHQAQIRDAVGIPRLLTPRWVEPLLNFSVRALPPVYAHVSAPEGTSVTLAVAGETSLSWTLLREDASWALYAGAPRMPDASVHVSTDDAWRLFFHGLSETEQRTRVAVRGDEALAAPLLTARSVIR